LTAKLTANPALDMSAAPEIARLAGTLLAAPHTPPAATMTLGTLARHLRAIAAAPERWWGMVRFDPDHPVRITVERHPSYDAWLVILPPGDAGQSCDCDVVTMIAGEATEGAAGSPALRPGALRVHGRRHRLRGRGAGYSVSLHARASRG
jgi:hypothetical protein